MAWELHGVRGGASPPPFNGDFPLKDRACLVVGSARCVWDDLGRWIKVRSPESFDTIAINSIIPYVPWTIQHAASLEHRGLIPWLAVRKIHQPVREPHIFTHAARQLIPMNQEVIPYDFLWDFDSMGGTSGLFAVKIALAMGYPEVVMAGIPIDDSGRFHDPTWMQKDELIKQTRCEDYSQIFILQEWMSVGSEVFGGRVKSLSGRTRDLFGEPNL